LGLGKLPEDVLTSVVELCSAAGGHLDLTEGVVDVSLVVRERLQHIVGLVVGDDHHLYRWVQNFPNKGSELGNEPIPVDGAGVVVVEVEHNIDRTEAVPGKRLGPRNRGWGGLTGRRLLAAVIAAIDLIGEEREVGDRLGRSILGQNEIVGFEIGDGEALLVGDIDIDVDHAHVDLSGKGETADDIGCRQLDLFLNLGKN